jgi:acetylornithine deacetylase/succinyl-diaminopimelate desuccinylase-like protein
VATLEQAWLDELSELLRIPSISADPAHGGDVQAAAAWVAAKLRRGGGEGEVVDWHGHPLAVGELPASQDAGAAPTVLCYGHFDVQPPAPLDLWTTEPFEPTVRDGWLYARGVADDKGQLWMLLEAASQLAAEGRLPVNVRFACDGEEETGGHSIVDFVAQDERGADVAVIFDSGFLRRGVPVFNIAVRGMCYLHVTVRTGERDLHSGMFGGAALNALHALMRALQGILAGPDGHLPAPLREGMVGVTEAELESWRALQPGAEVLAEAGARPMDPAAAEEFYLRAWAEPAVDVHGLEGGSPQLQKTVLPVVGEANVSMRLIAGQTPEQMFPVLQRLIEEAAPEGAEVDVRLLSSSPGALIPPDSPAIQIGLDAFERAVGVRPLLVRSGGSIPLVPALADKGIPTVVTGFDLPEGNIHSPNERMLLEHFPLGLAAARELFTGYGGLR